MKIPFSFGAGTGVDILDNNGNVVDTPNNIPTKSAQTYTPNSSAQTISSGQYLLGAQTIKGSANLVARYIRSGVTLWGVTGTLVDRYSGRTQCFIWDRAS